MTNQFESLLREVSMMFVSLSPKNCGDDDSHPWFVKIRNASKTTTQ